MADEFSELHETLQELGLLNKLEIFKEQERILRELNMPEKLAACLKIQALLMYDANEKNSAMEKLEEAEHLLDEKGRKDMLPDFFSIHGDLLQKQNRWTEAEQVFRRMENICRETRDMTRLGVSLAGQAFSLMVQGELDKSLKLYKEQENICRQTDDKKGVIASLDGQIRVLMMQGKIEASTPVWEQKRQLEGKETTMVPFADRVNVFLAEGNVDTKRFSDLKFTELSYRLSDDEDGIMTCIGEQADVLLAGGNFKGALILYKEKERFCRKLNKKEELASCLFSQAYIFGKTQQSDYATALYQQSETLCRESGKIDLLLACLINRASILIFKNDLSTALELYKEAEHISRNSDDQKVFWVTLSGQAEVLKKLGNLDGAEDCCTKAIQAAPENGRLYLQRGFIRAAKSLAISEQGEYYNALKLIAADYNRAHCFLPDDPESGASVIEIQICLGQADKAAEQAHKLLKMVRDENWRGVYCWLGALASILAGDPEEKWAQLRDNLSLAGKGLTATLWNIADVEKYLTQFACKDVPSDRVTKALQLHRSIVGRKKTNS